MPMRELLTNYDRDRDNGRLNSLIRGEPFWTPLTILYYCLRYGMKAQRDPYDPEWWYVYNGMPSKPFLPRKKGVKNARK